MLTQIVELDNVLCMGAHCSIKCSDNTSQLPRSQGAICWIVVFVKQYVPEGGYASYTLHSRGYLFETRLIL